MESSHTSAKNSSHLLPQNPDSPFTEIFTILKKYHALQDGSVHLAYRPDELKILNQHVSESVNILLHGLQELGQLLSVAMWGKINVSDNFKHIGYFTSYISNLIRTLTDLQLEANDQLVESAKGSQE